jgi:short-subunit dehydrogenase
VREEVGVVSILINNVGIVNGMPLLETPDSELTAYIEILNMKV